MATLNDVILTGASFQNLNTATGLITGTPLVIQNKGTSIVRLIISSSQPAANNQNGYIMQAFETRYVENETDIVWAKADDLGATHLSVQQLV